tara:strand:+ start:512 stop:616 length:105 start_codon:yes stop_codon:yes gene_type:complete
MKSTVCGDDGGLKWNQYDHGTWKMIPLSSQEENG